MDAVNRLDATLMAWMRAPDAPWLDTVMTWISAGGGAGRVWLPLAVVALMLPRHRAAAWRVVLTIALCYAVVDGVVKPLTARPRPSAPDVVAAPRENVTPVVAARALPPAPGTSGFPSGHAAASFGAAVAVSRMWPRGRVVWWALALLVGYSRIYLGHHDPLDVAGGALLGVAIAFWVLGGRHPATDSRTLPHPLPAGVVVRP